MRNLLDNTRDIPPINLMSAITSHWSSVNVRFNLEAYPTQVETIDGTEMNKWIYSSSGGKKKNLEDRSLLPKMSVKKKFFGLWMGYPSKVLYDLHNQFLVPQNKEEMHYFCDSSPDFQ